MVDKLMTILHDGQKHSRLDLASRLGVSDRKMRNIIEDARREGYIVLNDQDGTGYYSANDLDALLRHYKQERSRALSILVRLKRIRRILREAKMI